MTKRRTTKSALMLSVLALVLCFAMLTGTTFAWFTDTAKTGVNKIQAGTLKIDLEIKNEKGEYESVKDTKAPVFNYDKWEPGYVAYANVKLQNEGSLALKYKLEIIQTGETNADVDLADVIDVYLIEEEKTLTRADLADIEPVCTLADVLANREQVLWGVLYPKDNLPDTVESNELYATVALKMRETAGNEYQGLSIGASFDIILKATQFTYEEDSFDSSYDESAEYPENPAAAPEIITIEAGETYTLSGSNMPTNVSGEGTLILDSVNIVTAADNVNALSLINFKGDIVLVGENNLQGGKGGNGIYVDENSVLNLTGDSLTAVGNAGTEYASAAQYSTTDDTSFAGNGGSGIGGEGTINIDGVDNLTALGYGVAGFGIGGNTSTVTIKNTTVTEARGGFVNTTGEYVDAKYLKGEPEGGAAIGSMKNGAVITLENVTVENAVGGSKSAGIGARYWTAVTINITDSTVKNVIGGNSSAGIGGSRIRETNPADQDVVINIKDSTVTAKGGEYGAGIGSGYDTHCHTPENFPIVTINIMGESTINAAGGKYAAGIGTGYHAGGLDGVIEDTVNVTAVSGVKFYKDTYTQAQDVGFGIIDPARDGLNNTCTLNYKGTEIGVPAVN